MNAEEKLTIIGKEYDIPIEEHIRKDVSYMCNLSQGIEEMGVRKGMQQGESLIIRKMHHNGFSAEQIALATDKDIEDVKAILAGQELTLV